MQIVCSILSDNPAVYELCKMILQCETSYTWKSEYITPQATCLMGNKV